MLANNMIIDSIYAARMLTSRFYMCSLHVHSPGSFDYGRSSDLEESPNDYTDDEKQLSPLEWITKVERKGIEVIVPYQQYSEHGV